MGIRFTRRRGLIKLPKKLCPRPKHEDGGANPKGNMKAFVRSIQKMGDTFVKAYLMSLMIAINPGSQTNTNRRY